MVAIGCRRRWVRTRHRVKNVRVVATEDGRDSAGTNESQLVAKGIGNGARGRYGEKILVGGVAIVEQ